MSVHLHVFTLFYFSLPKLSWLQCIKDLNSFIIILDVTQGSKGEVYVL